VNAAAQEIITRLQLEPLPQEGGFFRVTWRNATASAILFLITPEHFSALHRLTQDEMWFFHTGDPVEHLRLDPRAAAVHVTRLGPAAGPGDLPQLVVPAGVWQGARPADDRHGYSLLGCTVSPPWEESGFELGDRTALQDAFPAARALIQSLTR
jgi:predicted cupin superfamily sugar epimerase